MSSFSYPFPHPSTRARSLPVPRGRMATCGELYEERVGIVTYTGRFYEEREGGEAL